MRKKILAFGAVVTTCCYPILFMYFMNAGELQLSEIAVPIAVYLACGLLLLLLLAFLQKSLIKGALASILICLLLFNYNFLENVIVGFMPRVKYWHCLPVCIFMVSFLIWLINWKLNENSQEIIITIMTILFSSLILLNFIMAIPELLKGKENDISIDKQIEVVELKGDLKYPDIYYLIFDEYSAFDVMQKYFGYDNYAFGKRLEELGFSVSYDSKNESSVSSTVLGNYANLDYLVNDTMAEVDKKPYRTKGYLWDLIEQNNYESQFVGLTSCFGRESAIGNSEADSNAVSVTGESFFDLILKNSVLNPFLVQNDAKTNENALLIEETFQYLQTIDFENKGNHFVQSYLLCPHQPFLYDADGKLNDSVNFNNWQDPQYYLNYFIYATNQIEKTVTYLVENDPNCIIILQSDHSCRYLMNSEKKYYIENGDKLKILNAVYYQGKKLEEIEGQSGVNTLRIIFGNLFDINLPIVEVPGKQ